MAVSDDAAIYVDAGRPATLNDEADAQTDCRTLQEVVSAWLALRWRPIAPRASDAITFLASAHAGWFVNIAG